MYSKSYVITLFFKIIFQMSNHLTPLCITWYHMICSEVFNIIIRFSLKLPFSESIYIVYLNFKKKCFCSLKIVVYGEQNSLKFVKCSVECTKLCNYPKCSWYSAHILLYYIIIKSNLR